MATKHIPQTERTRKIVTATYVRSILHYEPGTGIFRWNWIPNLHAPVRSRIYGKFAGSLNTFGHRQIRIKGVLFLASHLAWLVMTGSWPSRLVDHENTNPADDRWINLRLATRLENTKNRRVNKNNRSGLKGVKSRANGRYEAAIQINKKQIYLGTFDRAKDAHAAYCVAAKKYHGAFARTR